MKALTWHATKDDAEPGRDTEDGCIEVVLKP
jgi:hypothetical protein